MWNMGEGYSIIQDLADAKPNAGNGLVICSRISQEAKDLFRITEAPRNNASKRGANFLWGDAHESVE